MDAEMKQRFRKFLLICVAITMTLILAIWAWHYLRNGKIVITTNSKADVIILERLNKNGQGKEKVAESTGGELSVVVPAGTYRAKVGGRLMPINKTIDLKARKTEKHNLNPVALKSLEPVTPMVAESLTMTESGILYLAPDGYMHRLSSANPREDIGETQFTKVEWGSKGLGVGQDSKGDLYLINNGSVAPLNPPVSDGSKAINYTVSSSNRIYVSVGSDVYLREEDSSYNKIHTTTVQAPKLSASDDRLAVFNPPSVGGGHDAEEDSEPFVEIVKINGETIARSNISAFSIAWAPDAKRFISIDYFGKDQLYDSTLKSVSIIPSDDVQKVIWLDNNTLIYNTDGLLWKYRPEDNTANMLSSLTAGSTITDMMFDPSRSYVYLQTSSDEKKILQRLSLKNQKPPENVMALNTYLPKRLGGCMVSYINLVEPTVLISPESDIDPQSCVVAAQQYLKGYDLNPESFKYIFYTEHND